MAGRGLSRCSSQYSQFLKYSGTNAAPKASLIRAFSATASEGYHGLNSENAKSHAEWTGTKEELDDERLDIDGHPVMQRWETPYMASLAKIATAEGGRVLEIGFGMGISAGAIQKHDIAEHVILEANADVFKRLQQFSKTSPHKVTPIGPGLWQDTIKEVEDGSISGILYDTYPLVKEEQHTHQFDFIGQAFEKLRPGGVLTYCNLTSLGVLRGEFNSWKELFAETQLPHLLACGFREEDIRFEVAPAAPTADCEYYQHDTALVPICYRPVADPMFTGLGQKE